MSIKLIGNKLRGIGKKYLNRQMAMCDTNVHAFDELGTVARGENLECSLGK